MRRYENHGATTTDHALTTTPDEDGDVPGGDVPGGVRLIRQSSTKHFNPNIFGGFFLSLFSMINLVDYIPCAAVPTLELDKRRLFFIPATSFGEAMLGLNAPVETPASCTCVDVDVEEPDVDLMVETATPTSMESADGAPPGRGAPVGTPGAARFRGVAVACSGTGGVASTGSSLNDGG